MVGDRGIEMEEEVMLFVQSLSGVQMLRLKKGDNAVCVLVTVFWGASL